MKWYWKIFLIFAVWRLLLFAPVLFAEQHVPKNPGSDTYTMWAYTTPYAPVNSFLLYPWANFDGVHYLTIAGDANYKDNADGRFFPIYPLTISLFYFLLGGGPFMGLKEFFVGFVVSHAIFLAALLVMYKLLRIDYSEKVTLTTIILLLLFPTAFFFGSFYSEGTFLLLTFLTFYFIRKKQFLYASIATMLLSLSRIVGVCMIPITAYFYIQENHKVLRAYATQTFKERWHTWKPLLILPLGLLLIAVYSFFRWHDILYVIHAQQGVVEGRKVGQIIFFPQTLVRYIRILFTVPYTHFDWWISFVEFCSFWFGTIGLWYAWKMGIQKRYILFSVFALFVATQSGTFSGLPRYVLVLFPIFLALALNKSWIVKGVYILLGVIALFFLLACFAKGYYIA